MNMNENTTLNAEKKANDNALVVEIEALASQMLQLKENQKTSSSKKFEKLESQIVKKIIELKHLQKYFYNGDLTSNPVDGLAFYSAVKYAVESYGKKGAVVRDEKTKKEYYKLSQEEGEVIPFMYFFNVAFSKKKVDSMDNYLNELDGDNRKAKEAFVKLTIQKMAKEMKNFKLGRITCKVLSRNAVQKFMTAKGFSEANILKVLTIIDSSLVCSSEAGVNDDGENCKNSLADMSSYNRYGAAKILDNMWCALYDAVAQAIAEKDTILKTYIEYIATYNFQKEAMGEQSLELLVGNLLDKEFGGFLQQKPECVNEMKLEDAILAFYEADARAKQPKRETVQKHIAHTRRVLQSIIRHGAA